MKNISLATGVLARFDIYQDLSLLGFWIFIVAGVSLMVAGAYHIIKPWTFFKSRGGDTDRLDKDDDEAKMTENVLPVVHQVIKDTPAPVAVLNNNLQFLTASREWITMFGLSEKSVFGKSFYEVFPGSRMRWEQIHQHCLKGNRQKFDRDVFIKPDGKSEWLGFDLHPWYLDQDCVGGLLIYAEFTTDKHKADRTLKRAKELVEEASRSKADFISNMSHELCTPLTAILGYAQMLELDSELSSGQMNQVKEIRKSGEHLLSIIKDILELAKLGTHKVTFDADSIHLAELVEGIVRNKRDKFANPKINIEVDVDPDIPASLISDRQKLETIIDNLLDNAFKFTKEGDITVIVSLVQVAGKVEEDPVLNITVGDTGSGISPSKLDQIFAPFTQLNQHFVEGAGMGLALSKGFAEFLGGSLEVASEYGMGSVFVLKIPVQIPSQSVIATPQTDERSKPPPDAIKGQTPKEVSEFVRSLGEPAVHIIREALRLKDTTCIMNLEKILDLQESKINGALRTLKHFAETEDFHFMDSVNMELEVEA